MKDWFHINGLKLKSMKIFLILLGLGYSGFGLFSWFSMSFQLRTFEEIPRDEFVSPFLDSIIELNSVWQTFMPLLALLGVSYLFFGIFLEKAQRFQLSICLLLGFLSVVWVVAYAFASTEYLESFSDFGGDLLPSFGSMVWLGGILGLVQISGIFVVPQILIIRWIVHNSSNQESISE
ncbi:hypothetical protein OAE48_04690 [Flavobacteriales bacterium]|nr:hypothetical protein [Flavobacteriales bacterium]